MYGRQEFILRGGGNLIPENSFLVISLVPLNSDQNNKNTLAFGKVTTTEISFGKPMKYNVTVSFKIASFSALDDILIPFPHLVCFDNYTAASRHSSAHGVI